MIIKMTPVLTNFISSNSLFTPVDIFPETQFGVDGYRNENLQISDATYKSKVIAEGSNGKTLRIGKAKYSIIGQTTETAVCKMLLNDDDYDIPLLYTDQYLPECSIFKPKTKDYDKTYYGKGDPLGKVNNRCFSIVNQELWDCSYETTEVTKGVSKKVNKSFQRRVTEMVGAIPVEKVEYFGAVSIWKYRLDSKSSSVRIKEIYYHANNIYDQVVFAGTVKLKEPSGPSPVVKQEPAYLYKYNSTVISELPKLLGDFERGDSGMVQSQSNQGKNTNFI
ncbi:uncharacterized protein LOC111052895 isoform X2 [Nilaparvata lugens]|uniref:uncharacterized protein LOC111052895 isoform X2 n=1 Tax=Nilaparvata lugens TaxID=108931 RepID=UPI00193CA714|nr:uncharacterized protein LOC111052895 isoform X2 [Nilaparvata lugens]